MYTVIINDKYIKMLMKIFEIEEKERINIDNDYAQELVEELISYDYADRKKVYE